MNEYRSHINAVDGKLAWTGHSYLCLLHMAVKHMLRKRLATCSHSSIKTQTVRLMGTLHNIIKEEDGIVKPFMSKTFLNSGTKCNLTKHSTVGQARHLSSK